MSSFDNPDMMQKKLQAGALGMLLGNYYSIHAAVSIIGENDFSGEVEE